MKSFLGVFAATTSIAVLGAVSLSMTALGDADGSPLGSLRTTETRANTYTFSAQEDPSVAIDADGRILTTWSSRRQELGNYGVFAQLLDPLGRPLGTEMHVNQTLPGAQLDSYAVFGPDGTAWVAWSSIDPRTENNGIFLRRFADSEAGFGPAGDEYFIGGEMFDIYTDPALAVNGAGELLVTWVRNELGKIVVEGRRVSAAGQPLGEAFRLSSIEKGIERMPDVVALPDGSFTVVWQRANDQSMPLGIFGRRVLADGTLTAEFAVDDQPGAQHVEPSIDVDAAGHVTVAWMAAAKDSADYVVRVRRFAADGTPQGASFVVEAGGEGHRNGAIAVAAPDGGFLVAYNVHGGVYEKEDGRPARQVDIRARLFAADGKPVGDGYLVNEEGAGSHAMQVARNGRHAVWSAAGPLAFAWSGSSKEDGSGVAVRILTPPGFDVPAPPAIEPRVACADLTSKDMERTVPPDPLPDWRRALPRINADYSRASGFIGHDQTGWEPPDPDLAVGPDRIVSQVNCETKCFDKAGNIQWTKINYGANGFWAGLGAEDFVFDPICVYDWQSGRFIIANSELASDGDYICLAVSKDATPDSHTDWWKYRVKVSPTCQFPDFPNMGVGRDYITVSTDCFSGGGNRVMIFDKAAAASGTLTWFNRSMSGSLQSLGGVKNYDSANGYMYFVGGVWSAGSQIRIQCKTDTSTANAASYWLPVSSFGNVTDAPQQGSSNLLSVVDCRIKNGVVRNGRLYAAHGIGNGGVTKVRWYEIDLRGWPTSGNNPVLLQEGNLNLGSGVYSWFPDIHVDALGSITIAYNRSASNELASVESVYQKVGDAAGSMRTPLNLITSSAPYTGSRYGDYGGVDEDPANPGTFFSHHEYSVGPWETWIGTWVVDSGAGDPTAAFSGTPTSGNEDLFVAFTDASTGTGLHTWAWDFGDGATSSVPSPSHTYVDPGTYTVSLTVTGTLGSDSEVKASYIVVNQDPVAAFTATPTSGDEDLFVAFNNQSTGTALTNYDWTFGDGGTSTLFNPSHVYVDPGTYTVSLTVTGSAGTDTETKVNYIVVNDVANAAATPYNGSGINPNILTSITLPILGTSWKADIDGGSVGAVGISFLVGYSAPITGVFTGVGELLIDVTSGWMFTSVSAGSAGISHHTRAIPNDSNLAGIHSYVQGFLNNVGGSGKLTNAYDLELGS